MKEIDKIARVIVFGEQSSLMFESILNKKSFKTLATGAYPTKNYQNKFIHIFQKATPF